MLSSLLSRCLISAGALILAGTGSAPALQAPGTLPPPARVHAPHSAPAAAKPNPAHSRLHQSSAAQPPASRAHTPQARSAQVRVGAVANAPAAPPAASSLPPSLLSQPPQPATVTLSGGELAVTAHNSSLTQILHKLASSTGMTIAGLGPDQRVFGTYGPGNPTTVLSSLLEGAGYNVMILGLTPDGAPRQIILTARGKASAQPQAAQVQQPDQQSDDTDDDDGNGNGNGEPNFPIIHQSPEVPSPPEQAAPGGVKTPAQILQELQQIRQQQEQQRQQQPQ